MITAHYARFVSAIFVALAIASVLVLPVDVNPAAAASMPIHRTFWLKGHYILGWNNTSPGPFISVVSGDLVTMMLIGTDGFTHSWFLDFNNNLIVDPSETATASPNFSSTTAYLNFTFTPVISTNIPAAGNWTYRCSFHPLVMFGTFRVMPEQIPVSVSSSATLDSSKVTSMGSLSIDARTFQVSGSVAVTAADSVTGATTFTKTYTIPPLQMLKLSGSTLSRTGFLVNVAVMPYALSSDIVVQLQGLTASASVILTRQLDLDGDAVINIIDVGIVAGVYGTSTGNPRFNPLADFDANGVINIIDIGIIAAYYNDSVFR